MCAICGCAGADGGEEHDHVHGHDARDHAHDDGHGHAHPHDHDDAHEHDAAHGPRRGTLVRMEQAVLAKNDRHARHNRAFFRARGVLALNLTSAPGAGKTALLERTIRDLAPEVPLAVIEGDQESENDARRIRATGCPAIQINTGAGCHLDARRVGAAARALEPRSGSVLFIENVGNLVCPALFDLGERAMIVVLSVTEGEDKPIKYPHMFRAARAMVLSKTDLLPHLDVDADLCVANARRVNPGLAVFRVSTRLGHGLAAFYAWLRDELADRQEHAR